MLLPRQEYLRNIPSVSDFIEDIDIKEMVSLYGHSFIVKKIQNVIQEIRKNILNSSEEELEKTTILYEDIKKRIISNIKQSNSYNLVRVINGTGIILHTNLGRAPLAVEVIKNLEQILGYYCNLEYLVKEKQRGNRTTHIEKIIAELTESESAVVVNNNAAALFLTLTSLARGKEVIISRGELIEIGDSFRIPEIMKESGAFLVEIGTTNRTHLKDYLNAISEKTALILKVHTSNFKIIGFTSEVLIKDLVALGKEKNIPILYDLGSGNFLNLSSYGIKNEPVVKDIVSQGVDIVTFSGDKLLGGPQAGIIVGKKIFLDKIKKHPLYRILRVDKLTIGALEATLRLFLNEEKVKDKIPVIKMITLTKEELENRANLLFNLLSKFVPKYIKVDIKDGFSEIGGGTMPGYNLPTKLISIKPVNLSLEELEKKMREFNPPVISRICEEEICLDMRTIIEEELNLIYKGFLSCFKEEV